MFGFLIPRNYTEALEFDKANSNSKWYDATKAELDSIHSYEVFQKHEKAQYDKQKKVINAPPGYQKIRVHLIFAVKYDLSSGKRWAETIHDILKDMNFIPSQADQCIQLERMLNSIFMNTLLCMLMICALLHKIPKKYSKSKYNLKVKGDGPLTYHLGADYFQDPDGTMVSQSKNYIEKLKETYVRLFNTEPSKGLKTPIKKMIILSWIHQKF